MNEERDREREFDKECLCLILVLIMLGVLITTKNSIPLAIRVDARSFSGAEFHGVLRPKAALAVENPITGRRNLVPPKLYRYGEFIIHESGQRMGVA